MPPRPKGPDSGALSRKRTADLLRQLRDVDHRVRMLKADIEAAKKTAPAGETHRYMIRRRR